MAPRGKIKLDLQLHEPVDVTKIGRKEMSRRWKLEAEGVENEGEKSE